MFFLGALVLLFVIFTALWKRLVLSRKRLTRLLEAAGFGIVEFDSKYLIGEGKGMRVCFVFDRPFMGPGRAWFARTGDR